MWPGQAMTLKVNQILHHEKSKYQDVLIFESSDYGTVLVLDNVIQCTERDEFAYVWLGEHIFTYGLPPPIFSIYKPRSLEERTVLANV